VVRVAIHGHVVDASTNTPVEGGRVCLTSGDALVAGGAFGTAGDFRLEADVSDGAYHALLLVGGLDGWRRLIDVAGEAVDIDAGSLQLRPCEMLPGVHAQAWDVVADRPAPAGRISLWRGEKLLANAAVGSDGRFSFDLTCRQPLPPGAYSLVPEITGYAQDPIPLAIVERITVYQLGRLDLWAADWTAPAGR
jgi:hypothetical protein